MTSSWSPPATTFKVCASNSPATSLSNSSSAFHENSTQILPQHPVNSSSSPPSSSSSSFSSPPPEKRRENEEQFSAVSEAVANQRRDTEAWVTLNMENAPPAALSNAALSTAREYAIFHHSSSSRSSNSEANYVGDAEKR